MDSVHHGHGRGEYPEKIPREDLDEIDTAAPGKSDVDAAVCGPNADIRQSSRKDRGTEPRKLPCGSLRWTPRLQEQVSVEAEPSSSSESRGGLDTLEFQGVGRVHGSQLQVSRDHQQRR